VNPIAIAAESASAATLTSIALSKEAEYLIAVFEFIIAKG
jgi:hypothetical protein